MEEQSRLLATGLYDYTSGDRALDLLTANNSAVGRTIGAGKMVVGGAETYENMILALAGDAVGAQTVSEAAASSYADARELGERGARELFSADYRAPLGQGVLKSLNPDNPVSVQDQVLQQRLEQAGLPDLSFEAVATAATMAAAGKSRTAVRSLNRADGPGPRDIGEKAGRALDRVAEKVGLGGLKPATAGGINPKALTRTTPDTPAANAFLREGPNTPATPDVAAKGVVDEAGKTAFDRKAITKGFQDHHIISNKNELTKDHKLIERADFDLDSRANRLAVPFLILQLPDILKVVI